MFNGETKAITFSYDDAVTQDERLIDLFNKYGIKATFNLNSGLLGHPSELIHENVRTNHNKVKPEDVRHIYEGHEVAAHTLTHPFLPSVNNEEEIISLQASEPSVFYVFGHSYEFDIANTWDRFEEFLKLVSGKNDIYYCTNREILLAKKK